MNFFGLTIAFIFGSFFGSFFNAVAIRYAKGEFKKNLLKALISRSHCPHCNITLKPKNLIPIISYFFQRGRCSHCGKKISLQYLIAELIFGFLLMAIIARYGISLYHITMYFILSLAITISIIDIKLFKIPNFFILIILVLSIYPIIHDNNFSNNIYGLLLMSLPFTIIFLLLPGSFGGGDIIFASTIGLLYGLDLSIVILETSLISGALFGIFYAVITKKGLRTKIPFGPFLAFGMIIATLYGSEIILIYSSTVHNLVIKLF